MGFSYFPFIYFIYFASIWGLNAEKFTLFVCVLDIDIIAFELLQGVNLSLK